MTSDDRQRPGSGFGPGSYPDDGIAVVAGVVIETRPGQGPFVACRLEEIEDLKIVGGDGDRRLAAVWSAPSSRTLEAAVQDLVRGDEDILGVFPTFIGRDDTEEDPTAEARSGAIQGISASRSEEEVESE